MGLDRIVLLNGTAVQYRLGLEPRDDGGPNFIYNDGYMAWYVGTHLHRTDGPAFIASDGHKSYHINGESWSKDRYIMFYEIVYMKEYVEPNDSKWFFQEFSHKGAILR